MTKSQPAGLSAAPPQDVAADERRAPRMTRKVLLDSITTKTPVTDGKDPLRDLPIGGRRHRPAPPVLNENERNLLMAFQTWMKWPKESMYRERVSSLMDAHEVRTYIAGTR